MTEDFEWLCHCGESGTGHTFNRAYDLAYCHAIETLHTQITIVARHDFMEIANGVIAEAESIVQAG